MSRQRWIQDRVTGEFIPADEHTARTSDAPFIMRELQPYRSMVTGEMIEGRRNHREHLRHHGVIEVGNEKLTPKAEVPVNRDDIRRDIYQAMQRQNY